MYAPLPHNEDARIAALREYEILDTADEAAYDDIVQLAASICTTPMAAISLVDEYRQWFKARVGIGFRDTDRDVSICSHAILKPEQALVVPDTLMDERFSLSPFVVSKPNIRFYVGVPLVNPEGLVLGTLCVMDRECRGINQAQISSLQVLARQVIALLELRRTRIGLRRQADLLSRFSELAPVIDASVSNLVRQLSDVKDEPNLSEREQRIITNVDDAAKGIMKAIANLANPKLEVPKPAPAETSAPKPVVNSMPPPPPIDPPAAEKIAPKPEIRQSQSPVDRTPSKLKILVADDNEMNCLVLTAILDMNDCEVVCVENGEDALQKLARERFDLVFMDIEMPLLDGIQTACTIRRMPAPICHIPIVAMCSSLGQNEQSRARSAGMNDFVSKPISVSSVKTALDRWLVHSDATALI